MEEDDELEDSREEAAAPPGVRTEQMRTPVTILFTDIKGSTTYFEKHGDVAGMKWVQHHYDLLFPLITNNDGRVIKTIGDSIMACFNNQVGAVKAAVAMQNVLATDREGQPDEEQIHVRIGIHTGLGLIKDNDIFGDVVNSAARVQHQTEPDQILITEFLLDAARSAGLQCANFGKAVMKGKDEPIDIYAVAWSEDATQQLVETIQARFEARIREAKRQHLELEEEFERARDLWRAERRKLTAEMDHLEEDIERAKESARVRVSEDMQSEIRFQLEDSIRVRKDLEQQFQSAQAKWEAQRNNLKAQIASMQGAVIEAMERSNNPSRMALAVREQVDARLLDAKQEWQMQWDGDRRRLVAEIDRLKKGPGAAEEKKVVARRALLEKLGKLPPGSAGPAPKTTDQLMADFEDAKIGWETERDQLTVKIQRLENELQRTQNMMRAELQQELRTQYELKLAEANQNCQRLDGEVQVLTAQLDEERRRLTARIAELEQAVPEAQAAVRRQVTAELQSDFDSKIEASDRRRSRAERKLQDVADELEAERRRTRRQIELLESQLKEAKEAAFKAQRQYRRDVDEE